MGEGYEVNPDQLSDLASRFQAFSEEFDSILIASQAISQDDEAYGLLCSWMPAILEGRHQAFDEWVEYGQENMALLGDAVSATAEAYLSADEDSAKEFEDLAEELGQ